jgi:hypothetical protein
MKEKVLIIYAKPKVDDYNYNYNRLSSDVKVCILDISQSYTIGILSKS